MVRGDLNWEIHMALDSAWRWARGATGFVAVSAFAACINVHSVSAYSDTVNDRCSNDYHAYCRQHALGSTELRYCFEANRNKLSQACVNALVDAGEVPRKYLGRDGRK